jgi:diguanylate cyclase
MITSLRELPASVWMRVLYWTAIVLIVSTAVSIIVTKIIMESLGNGLSEAGLAAAMALPILIGGPMSLIHLLRLAQLRLANQKLQVLASTDWLTSCLNRRAFTNQVNGQLRTSGAFLVIDADHFKIINDRFGHDRGDEALQIMAATIRANVRDNDIVGRMGGEEFGVFLQGANLDTARLVAERIRAAIQAVHFAPDGQPLRLSVSVGGAFFDGEISFTELFRIADQRLYRVKQAGRNRTDIAHALDHTAAGMVATALAS